MKKLTPIHAYPVLFWFSRDFMNDWRKQAEMQRELNENVIYRN